MHNLATGAQRKESSHLGTVPAIMQAAGKVVAFKDHACARRSISQTTQFTNKHHAFARRSTCILGRPGHEKAGWEDKPWKLDMSDGIERAGTYALIYLAMLEHWNQLFPDLHEIHAIIPDAEAAWAYAREYCDLSKPPGSRKRSLAGHIAHKQRD